MRFHKEDLDLVLVPCGLLIMFVYHLFLLYRYLHQPHTTVMGFEDHDRRAWVKAVVQVRVPDARSPYSRRDLRSSSWKLMISPH